MRRRFREALDQVFSVDDTPHRIGLAFALGTFLAMSWMIGLHTILGLVLAHSLGLSRRVTMAGVFLNNPWTIVPIYSFCLAVGLAVTGRPLGVENVEWSGLSLSVLLHDLGHLILPFIVGTTLVGVLAAGLAYFLIKKTVIRFRGRRAR